MNLRDGKASFADVRHDLGLTPGVEISGIRLPVAAHYPVGAQQIDIGRSTRRQERPGSRLPMTPVPSIGHRHSIGQWAPPGMARR